MNFIINLHKTWNDYKEDIKINYECSLSVAYSPMEHLVLLNCWMQPGLTWDNYLTMTAEQHTDWEKKAYNFDMRMFLIQGCSSDDI